MPNTMPNGQAAPFKVKRTYCSNAGIATGVIQERRPGFILPRGPLCLTSSCVKSLNQYHSVNFASGGSDAVGKFVLGAVRKRLTIYRHTCCSNGH